MALYKEITQSNGIILSYHRIVAMHVITNVEIIVEVASYLNSGQRAIERTALEADEPFDVLVEGHVYNMPYSETESISSAYTFLKENVAEYEGSINV